MKRSWVMVAAAIFLGATMLSCSDPLDVPYPAPPPPEGIESALD